MKTYISILRGINVSGHNLIKMDALKQLYTDLKFVNIETYIQSGNVVFQYKDIDSRKLEIIISKRIKQEFNFDIPVFIIDSNELAGIIKKNPFAKDKLKDDSFFHISFLSTIPESQNIAKLDSVQSGSDLFIINGNIVYLYCPDGYGRTKFTNTFLENKLKVNATTRNWKTLNQLLKMSSEKKIPLK